MPPDGGHDPGTGLALADMSPHPVTRWSTCVSLVFSVAIAAAAEPGGTLSGTVRLSGPPPAPAVQPVFKHPEVCGPSVPDDHLVVGPGGGVRYAVVTLEGVPGGQGGDRDAVVVLNNLACRFDPHVLVAEVGQTLELRNGDPILHNADARIGQETLFNVALTPGRVIRKPLARAGLVKITCDVRHTWMSAFVMVADHRFHTVTDAEGVYELRDVPPGTYTLRTWHETLGTREQQVTVAPGRPATVDVTFPARDATPAPVDR